jgi:hypothetical protein
MPDKPSLLLLHNSLIAIIRRVGEPFCVNILNDLSDESRDHLSYRLRQLFSVRVAGGSWVEVLEYI